jgi:D-3-phosphoglycerate dehydrogenase
MRQIPVHDRALRNGEWNPAKAWPHWHLHGRILGLVGFGHAARLVAKKMSGFDLTVLAYDPYIGPEVMARAGVRAAGLEEVLSQSDFVSLNCPLTKDTFHLIGEAELRRMKPTAILVNTARGPVIDEPALVRALSEGWIAAAGLDVLEDEHADLNNPLFKMDNVVITPHIAGASDEHAQLCWRLSVDSALALAGGRWPRSVVNRAVTPRWPLALPEARP